MKSLCLKKIPDDLYHDLKRIQEIDRSTITSMFIEGARLRVKEKGTQIAESRKRRNSLNDMAGY